MGEEENCEECGWSANLKMFFIYRLFILDCLPHPIDFTVSCGNRKFLSTESYLESISND